ncbi:hypothetical protein DPMN_132331 [Dreissena polymorpha]|uniref:Uncharacterized protein n=1 Tax=Dreissena polymorpha TaxID=45954 RepID=A0A9D4FRD1_DREPO|nr:hypothetical protein DPMN_132331 [Dreissena polymorpha]
MGVEKLDESDFSGSSYCCTPGLPPRIMLVLTVSHHQLQSHLAGSPAGWGGDLTPSQSLLISLCLRGDEDFLAGERLWGWNNIVAQARPSCPCLNPCDLWDHLSRPQPLSGECRLTALRELFLGDQGLIE